MELFRISKGLSAISMETFFELDNSGRTKGHSLKLKRKRFQTDTRKCRRSLSIVGICSMRVWFRQGPLMFLRKDCGSFVKQRKAA